MPSNQVSQLVECLYLIVTSLKHAYDLCNGYQIFVYCMFLDLYLSSQESVLRMNMLKHHDSVLILVKQNFIQNFEENLQ